MRNKSKSKSSILLIIVSGCLLYAFSAGLRSVYGIMLNTIATESGIAYSQVSVAIALSQLTFGLAQPFFGMVALKRSNRTVLTIGSILMAIGLFMIPFSKQAWVLNIFLGVLLPIGMGAVSFGMIMGSMTPLLGSSRWAVMASSLVNASSGLGSIIFSPIIQTAFSSFGLSATMTALALVAILLIPLGIVISREEYDSNASEIATSVDIEVEEKEDISVLIKAAFKDRSYLYLIIGFFTCGFHMAIVETHLFSQMISVEIPEATAAYFFSIYGFASITGSLLSGYLMNLMPVRYVLGLLYGLRVAIIIYFLSAGSSADVFLIIAISVGLTGAATVAPTSELVNKLFGSANLATLFGLVFLSHQMGSFISAAIGGWAIESAGNYNLLWTISAVLSFVAMLASFAIREKRVAIQ